MRVPDSEIAICSVGFGEAYENQLTRLQESLSKIYENQAPSAKLSKPNITSDFFWRGELPPGSKPFLDSLYGFKVHAVNAALEKGFKHIFWFDPAIIVQEYLDFYLHRRTDYPVIAIQDATLLADVCSQKAVRHFDIKRSWLCGKHLVGGSFYYFNFNNPVTWQVFRMWEKAELNGIFGSQDEEASEQLQGHRADETCLALSLYKNNLIPMPYTHSRYDKDRNPIIIKEHFK